jgi:L-ribulose-5-phosphate 4-epimerase
MTPADLVLTRLDGTSSKARSPLQRPRHPPASLSRIPQIGGVVHTHSEFATSWAQACQPIPCLGTTHADYFHGPVPVAAPLTAEEVEEAYVLNTGASSPAYSTNKSSTPSPFPESSSPATRPSPGAKPQPAVEHADLLEYIARLAYRTVTLGAPADGLAEHVAEHHYQRKHGPKATYGQKASKFRNRDESCGLDSYYGTIRNSGGIPGAPPSPRKICFCG